MKRILADVSACTALLHGEPADEIVSYADSIDADMIVVRSRRPWQPGVCRSRRLSR